MNCFLWLVDYALNENVLTEQMWIFAAYILYWEVVTRISILYLFWNVKLWILWLIKGFRLCNFSEFFVREWHFVLQCFVTLGPAR